MPKFYAIIQVPVTVKVQFQAKNQKEAIEKAKQMTPFEISNSAGVYGIAVSSSDMRDDAEVDVEYCELENSDLLYLEVGKGEEYKDEDSIIHKEKHY